MKIWQKLYLWTLVVFLIGMNLSVYLIFHMSYEKNISLEKETALEQWKVISGGLGDSIQALEDREMLKSTTLLEVNESFEEKYNSSLVTLQLWEGTTSISENETDITNLNGGETLLAIEETQQAVMTLNWENEIAVAVSGKITISDTQYTIVMIKELDGVKELWSMLLLMLVFIILVVSLSLAVVLYHLLRHFLNPLGTLESAADKLARGEYTNKLVVQGEDEIASLTKSFNKMAKEIQQSIERLREESENKQQFIDDMSHELKTPLTTIYGYAQLLHNVKVEEEKQYQYLSYIMNESMRMQEMTKELLVLTRLRHEEIVFTSFDNKTVVERVILPLNLQLEEKKIKLITKIEAGSSYGNQTLLENLLVNLIRNALCACGEYDTITVIVGRNQIKVIDTGCGMSKQCKEKIFEPFYREDKARSRKLGGTGLGMAIVKQIVDCHNGTIRIESEQKKGTTIEVVW